jgi:D-inositol-3-phosphate glycosyltransferase
MKPKRIVFISYHTCPLASQEGKESGGMNVYVLELAKELVRIGHIVDIYTRSEDSKHVKVVQVAPKLRVIHIKAGPEKVLDKTTLLPYLDEFVENYYKFVQAERISYAILHCHYYLSGLIGLKIKKKQNHIPFIMSFHTIALMKSLVARTENEVASPERVEAEFLLVEHADKIIVSSETDMLYMQYFYDTPREKLAVIPPGFDTARFFPINKNVAKKKIHVEEKQKIILFVGRIEPLKGIDTLIYAMKIIARQCPSYPIQLLIVGGDISQKREHWTKELQRLETLRKTLRIPNVVIFVGQRTQEELPYYYNSAEVVVMPSHYESFGMAAIEAMACGTPVITSNVTGVASLIDQRHASLITTVNNPLLLAAQIEQLLKDPEKRARVSEAGRKRIADLSWEHTAKHMLRVYNASLKLAH